MLTPGERVPFTPCDRAAGKNDHADASRASAFRPVAHAVFGTWHYAACAPDSLDTPDALMTAVAQGSVEVSPMPGAVPIASAMANAGQLDLDVPPDLDGQDWWIWCRVDLSAIVAPASMPVTLPVDDRNPHPSSVATINATSNASPNATLLAAPIATRDAGPEAVTSVDPAVGAEALWLSCDGLAGTVDVWWDGRKVGATTNMFVPWSGAVPLPLTGDAHTAPLLVLHCRAMTPPLTPRRPRARWRARLLHSQEWRWHRTTHLGRMPGVGPRIPPVGPWRPVIMRAPAVVEAHHRDVVATRADDLSTLDVEIRGESGVSIHSATLWCGTIAADVQVVQHGRAFTLQANLATSTFAPWWPHTHGEPTTYAARIVVHTADADYELSLGDVGFRALHVESNDETFGFRMNGHAVFLRGSCWTPGDWARLDTLTDQFEADIPLLVAAGINCVRFSGCFVYPTAQMLALCDRYGIAVWQDCMFSVLDYPTTDPAFLESVRDEVQWVARMLRRHACVVAICGNSEVEQQAAMMGMSNDMLPHSLFRHTIADAIATVAPELFYWPGTPMGGVLPMQLTVGTAHYFGVGAYQRPLHDARRAGVRFATECLAFANLPEPESPSAVLRDGETVGECCHVHVPKDGGASWDFADVRSHYVDQLPGWVNAPLPDAPATPEGIERFSACGRTAVVVAVEQTLQEFRRPGGPTRGALTWLWRDPWNGAGWGMVDHHGRPKSFWYAVRRACRPVAMAVTDEGLDGVVVHCWNDSPHTIEGVLTVRLLSTSGSTVLEGHSALTVAARGNRSLSVDAILGVFTDATNAYGFQTHGHDVVHVAWTGHGVGHQTLGAVSRFRDEPLVDDATLVVGGNRSVPADSRPLFVRAERLDDVTVVLRISCDTVAQWVRPACPGWVFDDAYFTLVPGVVREVTGRRIRGGDRPIPKSGDAEAGTASSGPDVHTWISVDAMNLHGLTRVLMPS